VRGTEKGRRNQEGDPGAAEHLDDAKEEAANQCFFDGGGKERGQRTGTKAGGGSSALQMIDTK
jgi:hypothetical protein